MSEHRKNNMGRVSHHPEGHGSTREILVDSDLVWPNGLTLDYDEIDW